MGVGLVVVGAVVGCLVVGARLGADVGYAQGTPATETSAKTLAYVGSAASVVKASSWNVVPITNNDGGI